MQLGPRGEESYSGTVKSAKPVPPLGGKWRAPLRSPGSGCRF